MCYKYNFPKKLYAIFRGVDPKIGKEGGAVLIEPALAVVKFDVDLIEHIEWDGFKPIDVDWKFDISAKKSKKETSIDLSKYILPKNIKWDNMDISVRQGGIITLIDNINEYGFMSNKSVDSLLLTGLDVYEIWLPHQSDALVEKVQKNIFALVG